MTESEIINPSPARTQRRTSRKIVLCALAALAVVLVVAVGLLAGGASSPPFGGDPILIRTTRPTSSISVSGMSLKDRVFWKYYEWRTGRFPNPLSYSFPAMGGPSPCSIHGLLNQCMEVGGTQYFIEKNVAAGSVKFGSTIVLNGQQWIDAFEKALQQDVPEWWDPETKGFRKENLVLLRYDRRTVLVLSPALAREYQQRYPTLQTTSQ